MVLGSDVPLEEDILKKPIEFVKDWVQWSSDFNTQIFEEGTLGAMGANPFYTVPKNMTLYITMANLCCQGPAAVSLTISGRGRFLNIRSSGANLCCNYSMPIKVNENEVIALSQVGAGASTGLIVGFLVPKRLS